MNRTRRKKSKRGTMAMRTMQNNWLSHHCPIYNSASFCYKKKKYICPIAKSQKGCIYETDSI